MTPMGRPKTDNPKDMIISFRADQALVEMINENAEYFGETKTETIRRAITVVNQTIKNK